MSTFRRIELVYAIQIRKGRFNSEQDDGSNRCGENRGYNDPR